MTTDEPFKRRYLVQIAVQRTETYAVFAEDEGEALATAFTEGDQIDSETTGVHEISAERDESTMCFMIELDSQPIKVIYRKAYFGECTDFADYETDHFEFCSPHNPPRRIPISETGYRSLFASSAVVKNFGDLRRFALREAWRLVLRESEHGSKQGGLF